MLWVKVRSLFVNPFALRGSDGRELIDLTRARIIGGGEATSASPAASAGQPSHARSRMIAKRGERTIPPRPGHARRRGPRRKRRNDFDRGPPGGPKTPRRSPNCCAHHHPTGSPRSIGRPLLGKFNAILACALDAAWRWRAMGPSLATTRGLYDAPERRVRERL